MASHEFDHSKEEVLWSSPLCPKCMGATDRSMEGIMPICKCNDEEKEDDEQGGDL